MPCVVSVCATDLPFTTSFHTRFPDYPAERLPMPERWTSEITWAWLRRFHARGAATLAATPTLTSESRRCADLTTSNSGRAASMPSFSVRAHRPASNFPRPILSDGRPPRGGKNLEAFLQTRSAGHQVVVGDGPARERVWRGNSRSGVSRRRVKVRRSPRFTLPLTSCVPEPHGYVRPRATGGAGERCACRRIPGRGTARRHWRCPVGMFDEDLRLACLGALECSWQDCRDFVLGMTWAASARIFLDHVTHGARSGRKPSAIDAGLPVNMTAGAEQGIRGPIRPARTSQVLEAALLSCNGSHRQYHSTNRCRH